MVSASAMFVLHFAPQRGHLQQETQIGTALSIGSIMSTFVITVLFPWLHRRFGTVRIYRYAMSMDVLFVILYPIVHAIAASAEKGRKHDPHDKGALSSIPLSVMFGLGAMLVVKALASLTWG